VLSHELTNVQEVPGIFSRASLWATNESPADNTISEDRAKTITTREPEREGLLWRSRPTSATPSITEKSCTS
jgi:hypothetical protein